MPDLRVMHTMEHDSAQPEDRITNVFHFTAPDALEATLDDISDAIELFYLSNDGYLAAMLSGAAEVRIYNLADPTPRVPIYERDYTLTIGTTSQPAEVALCMSFHGSKTSGSNQARRRGRIYFGPLTVASNTTGGFPTSQLVADLAAAGATLLADSAASAWTWCVRSEVNNNLVPITAGWVDNVFDTQRRRGQRATARTLF